jgi:hypothetical protein
MVISGQLCYLFLPEGKGMVLLVRITLLSFLCMFAAGVSLGEADMYVYRDAFGQQHLTNLRSKIPPKYRSRTRLIVQSKGVRTPQLPTEEPRPPLQPAAPATAPAAALKGLQVQMTQLGPPVPQQTVVTVSPPPQTTAPEVPPVPVFAQARPLSTSQFGLLQRRMTEAEVLQRLGPPAHVLHGRSAYRNIWYYPEGAGAPFTQLTFTAGKLTDMQRGFTQVR